MRNSPPAYNPLARGFHWAVAILIFGLLTLGWLMADIPPSPAKFQMYAVHKSFGILVLGLAVLRLAWRQMTRQPDPLPTHKPWEKILAHGTHYALYALIILMPLSGWVMSSAGGFPASFFGLFALPAIVPKDKALFDLMQGVHGALAWLIFGLVTLHIAGALKHHFIDRGKTFLRMSALRLNRMQALLWIAVALSLFSMPFLAKIYAGLYLEAEEPAEPPSAQTPAMQQSGGWRIDPAQSAIAFSVTQYGNAFTGVFKNFGGDIVFDPAHLDRAHVKISIDIASIDTGSADRDAQARGPEWFDASIFPRAVFESASFESKGGNRYVAHGFLMLRGVTKPLDLPFTLKIDHNKAVMDAAPVISRLAYGVGQGDWVKTDIIGDQTALKIHVQALQSSK